MIFGVSPGLTIASHTDVMRPVFAFRLYLFPQRSYMIEGKARRFMVDQLNFIPNPQRPKASISLRLPSDWLERIDALCSQLNMTRTALILQCIYFALGHLDGSS